MSSPTPEPPDEKPPKPPRKPPVPAKKDSDEFDLWDFDQTPGPPRVASVRGPETLPPPKNRPKAVEPVSRSLPKSEKPPADVPISPRASVLKPPSQAFDLRKKATDDLGDLDETWTGPETGEKKPRGSMPVQQATTPELKVEPVAPKEPVPAIPVIPLTPVAEPSEDAEPDPKDEEEVPENAHEDDETESASAVAPVPLELAEIRKRLGFSKVEKIGMIALAAVLIVAGITLITMARHKLGSTATELQPPSYPVKGSLITVKKLGTFWRTPIVGTDSARRDTKLIPVAKIEVEGGPCAVRAFFRDEKGDIVGDAVTRTVSTGTVEISATAGLEDPGMHAAFRTGATKLWKLEIFEASSADASRQDFKKVLETPVSADLQH